MKAKPEMKPWVNSGYKNSELRRSGTNSASIGIYPFGCAALLGLNKCIPIISPGLCRSIALTGLLYAFLINMLYYFDTVTLLSLGYYRDY